MERSQLERRNFLQLFGALGAAAAFPTAMAKAYDPAANFELKVTDMPYRRNAAGRQLFARVYQPQGAGPFPLVLDLHGGAWTRKDRSAEEPMDRAIAASGVVVVAIDLTLSGEAPYPANVQDANYAIRWLKSRAGAWNADGSSVGIYGSSTGGHIAILLAMRPKDARYSAIPLEGPPKRAGTVDASVAYVATRSPITDPYVRFQQAEKMKRDTLVKASKAYFQPWDSIQEANPQQILERKEPVTLRPLLIMQGDLDDNVLPAVQQKFADTYRAAGGDCRYELFDNSEHEWTGKPGPQTTRAHDMVKAFIARNVSA
jgi:acetyl esterase